MIKKILRSLQYRSRYILNIPSDFYKYYKSQQLTEIQSWFLNNLKYFKPQTTEENAEGVVLVQIVKDYEYAVKLAVASKVLADKYKLAISLYDVSWFRWIGMTDRHQTRYQFFFTGFLERIFRAFGSGVIFRNSSKYPDQVLIKKDLAGIVKKLERPSDILLIECEGILIGDLVYDTYLRYFHKPTIEEINKDVALIIEVGLNIFYNFRDLIEKRNVKKLVNTYTSYLEHGIPARICIANNIEVYTISSISYVAQKATKEFPYHVIDHSIFSPDKVIAAGKIDQAMEKFTSRFSGKLDHALSYMRKNPFLDTPVDEHVKENFAREKRNIVVYAHDFYDSPHVCRDLLFPDLYLFLQETLEAVKELSDTTVFIKPHPNGAPGYREAVVAMVAGFNKEHFIILESSVTNNHIIELKPDLICTARGTVGIEMAYFKIPTVALFDNPYANFKFVHTCQTPGEYFSLLRGETKPVIDFDRSKLYSFYYQAYLEKIEPDVNGFIAWLAKFNGDTFNDKYLEFLKESRFFDSKEVFLALFSSVIDKIEEEDVVPSV